jgi:hypothetical protein
MNIEMHKVARATLEEFADQHGLIMEVHERKYADLPQFYARFKNAEIKEDALLRGAFGDGSTPEAAIKNYAVEISGKLLVIDAYGKERREIRVPILAKSKEE